MKWRTNARASVSDLPQLSKNMMDLERLLTPERSPLDGLSEEFIYIDIFLLEWLSFAFSWGALSSRCRGRSRHFTLQQ